MAEYSSPPARPRLSEEVDLGELLIGLWRRWWIVLICLVAGVGFAVVKLNRSTYLYTATLRVAPVQLTQNGSGSRLGGLSALASAAGLGGGSDGEGASFLLYTKSVASRSVATALARQPEIMHRVFAGEWDPETQRYVEPRRGTIGKMTQSVKRLLGIPLYDWHSPDAARLQDYIGGSVKVIRDSDSPIVTLVYANRDPRFAATFLASIHSVLDGELRRKARKRASQNVAFLSAQLSSTQLVERRNAIVQALSEQEKNLMLASSTLAFAAEPMDFVTTSLRPTSPQPMLVLAVGLLGGAIIGIGAALVMTQVSRHRSRRPAEVLVERG